MFKKVLLLLMLLILVSPLFADQFLLKDGQKIEGKLSSYYHGLFKIHDLKGKLLQIKLSDLCSIIFSEPKVTISLLKTQTKNFLGKTVAITGQYLGWLAEAGAPPVTRSDWVLKDETGLIYITGKLPKFHPAKDKGKMIEVTGVLNISPKGQLFLKGLALNYPVCESK